MNTNPLARKLRGALAIGVALALSAPVVNAQEEDEPLEEIITTGSRIARNEFSSSSPITVVSGDEVLESGVVSIDEYFKDVPSFTGYQATMATNNGNTGGQKNLDLRGLGFNRTLVLINGRRMIGDTTGCRHEGDEFGTRRRGIRHLRPGPTLTHRLQGGARGGVAHDSGENESDSEFMQYRSPVGVPNPSGKTWPRCDPQFAQRTSVRTIPWLRSSMSSTASGRTDS